MASFSVFPGPIWHRDPVGVLDWTGLLAAVREGRHPMLGDWRDPLPMDREARKAEQRRRAYTTPNCTLRRRKAAKVKAFMVVCSVWEGGAVCAMRQFFAFSPALTVNPTTKGYGLVHGGDSRMDNV